MRSMKLGIGISVVSLLAIALWISSTREPEPVAEPAASGSISEDTVSEAPLVAQAEAVYAIPRTVRYRFLVTNRSGQVLEQAKLTMFSPLAATATQKTLGLDVSESYTLLEDALGNRVMEFRFDKFPPYATRVIDVQARMAMSDSPQPLAIGPNDVYLKDGPLYDMGNSQIVEVAAGLRLQDDAASARAIYDWVRNNLDYSGYIASDRGAGYAIRTRKGDCTEYAYLLAALARLNGIPARIMAGFVYANDAVLRPYDYHNWVEFYVDGRWQIVDPLNDMFFAQNASHVALRVLGGEQLGHLGSQKGIEAVPGLEVKME